MVRITPRRAAILLALLLVPVGTCAAPTACPEPYWHGEAPDLTNPKLAKDTRELCFTAFAVLHSGVTRPPLWSAEHLTRGRVEAAEQLERKNAFHAEPTLPKEERAELADDERTGFDRGHMAPAGDMPSPEAQHESFSLANIAPQTPALNRGLWEGVEAAVRELAREDGELYVVTGPIFAGERLQALHGRVLVPNETYKAVYAPRRGQAGAYVAENTAEPEWRMVSVGELARLSGIDPFPGLPETVKATSLALPAPEPYPHRVGAMARPPEPPGPGAWLSRLLASILGSR
jgi:endonuclease G